MRINQSCSWNFPVTFRFFFKEASKSNTMDAFVWYGGRWGKKEKKKKGGVSTLAGFFFLKAMPGHDDHNYLDVVYTKYLLLNLMFRSEKTHTHTGFLVHVKWPPRSCPATGSDPFDMSPEFGKMQSPWQIVGRSARFFEDAHCHRDPVW